MLLSIAVAVVVLLAMGLCSLLVFGSKNKGGNDLPTHTPPPTFTLMVSPTPRPTLGPTPTPSPSPTPTPIVVGWRELGHLAVDEYKARTVVEVERKGFWGTDRILLEAVGNIQIGIDMTKVQGSNVQIDGTSVKVVLPHATVTSVELLPGESRVYDSQRRWVFSEYEGIEMEALARARAQLKDWAAAEEAMLGRSESLARFQLGEFLRHLGFENIEIAFED